MKPTWEARRNVVAWAAQECEWQQSGEMSVVHMLDGWDFMHHKPPDLLTVELVQILGGIVEPRHNTGDNWRTCGVRVGMSIKPHQQEVPDLMERHIALIQDAEDWLNADADEWFRIYEEIHPFRDGNGRTGNILWNWLNGTLDNPKFPPNLWADPRR